MRSILLSLFFSVLLTSLACGQDEIIKRSGERLKAKVWKLDDSLVHYALSDTATIQQIGIAQVAMIRFSNGSRTVFNASGTQAKVIIGPGTPISQNNKNITELEGDPFKQGIKDANLYYKGYKGAATGTLVVSILMPVAGLLPAITTSLTPPASHTLNFPNITLMDDPEYARGYQYGASKLKSQSVWRNFAIGATTGALIGIAVYRYQLAK